MSQLKTDPSNVHDSENSKNGINLQIQNGYYQLFNTYNSVTLRMPSEQQNKNFSHLSNESMEDEVDIQIDDMFLNSYTNDVDKIIKTTPDLIFHNYINSIPKVQMYKGILLQGFLVPHKLLKGLEDFHIKSDDVIIASYPKSGTTWTEEIVSVLYNGGDTERCKSKNLIYRVIHLEVGRPVFPLSFLNNLKSPRLLATHFPWHLLPRSLQQEIPCKIIYIGRNPKDNAVSYFHHHRMASFLGNYKGSWDDFYHLFEQGKLVYGSWFDHVTRYWLESIKHPDKILFLKYEDMKRNLDKEVVKIQNFLGTSPLSREKLDKLVQHCSFDNMKSNTMVNREKLPLKVFDLSDTKFMRKGIVGDWKNYFTAEQNERFDALYDFKMKEMGQNTTAPRSFNNSNNEGTKIDLLNFEFELNNN